MPRPTGSMRAGARGGRAPRRRRRAPRGRPRACGARPPRAPRPGVGQLGRDRGAVAPARGDRGLAARGQRGAARAPVGRVGLAPHVAAALEVGDGLRRRLLADAQPRGQLADRLGPGTRCWKTTPSAMRRSSRPSAAIRRWTSSAIAQPANIAARGRSASVGSGIAIYSTMVVDLWYSPQPWLWKSRRSSPSPTASCGARSPPSTAAAARAPASSTRSGSATDDGLVGWLTSRPTPLRRAHLAANPHVSCSYWDPAHDVAVAECRAEWVTDPAAREHAWACFRARAAAARPRPRDDLARRARGSGRRRDPARPVAPQGRGRGGARHRRTRSGLAA